MPSLLADLLHWRDDDTGRIDWGLAAMSVLLIAVALAATGVIVAMIWSLFAPGKVDTGRITARQAEWVCAKGCTRDYSITLQDGHSFDISESVYRALAVGDDVAVTYQGILTDGVRRIGQ